MQRLRQYYAIFPKPLFREMLNLYFWDYETPETEEQGEKDMVENTWMTGLESLVRALPLALKSNIQVTHKLQVPVDRNPKVASVLNYILFQFFDKHGLASIKPEFLKQILLAIVPPPFPPFLFS